MITEVEEFFSQGCGRCPRFATPDCSTRIWAEGLAALRQLCLKAGLQETAKWGHPVYMHAGRNIAIIGAFRGDFRLSFFDSALMRDPEGLLQRQGENSPHPGAFRFTGNDQVQPLAPVILAYLAEAKSYAEVGIKPPKQVIELELPKELMRRWMPTQNWPMPSMG